MKKLALISENIIFTKIIVSFLKRKDPEFSIVHFSSFAEVKKKMGGEIFDGIIVDGIISGVASFEVINYLRLQKNFVCPIYFFSEVHADYFKSKAYEAGVNYYYEKPFDPHIVTQDIVSSLSAIEI